MKHKFDAAELVKQYRGERGIVEGEPCRKCRELGVTNPIFYYRDVASKDGKGRCYSCAHIEGSRATSKPAEFMELANGDKVYVGRKCSNCGTSYRVFDEATGERLGLSGKAKTGKCYHCARMEQQTIEPVAAHREFLEDVKRAHWKFLISSTERAGYVEVIAKDAFERNQIKQLVATAMMMNRHAEMADKPQRYDVDHYVPAAGQGDVRGMTNLLNLRIIRRDENQRKQATMPSQYQPEQILTISELTQINSYHEASKALKRWIDSSEQASDYTPERKAAYEKKQQTLRAEIEAIEQRIGEGVARAVYEAIDQEQNSILDVLVVCQNKLSRYKTAGNQKLVETYKKRLQLHGNRGFVKVEPPDLEAMAYIGKGAVLWAVEATVSNVIDGITLLLEKGMTAEEQRITNAIAYDCIGWALTAMDSNADVMPFVSPLLGVFGEKVFAVREKHGKQCLTVYPNTRTGQTAKALDEWHSTDFDGNQLNTPLISASDGDVLERLADFDNQTLTMQRQKEATASAKAKAVDCIKEAAKAAQEATEAKIEGIKSAWAETLRKAEQIFNDAEVVAFFVRQRHGEYQDIEQRYRAQLELVTGFINLPITEPAEAASLWRDLSGQLPTFQIPQVFEQQSAESVEQEQKERERLRAIGERMEQAEQEQSQKRAEDKQARADKSAWLRSPAGQAWIANQKRQQRQSSRAERLRGISRDNR